MSKIIQYNRDMFIFGEPVDVDGIGKVRFLTYKQYLTHIQELSIMKMNVLHIYYQYRKMFDENDPKAVEALEELKKESLINIVRSQKTFIDSYVKIFELVLDENSKNDSWSESLKENVNKEIEMARQNATIRDEKFTEPTTEQMDYLLLMKALELIFTNEEMFIAFRQLILDMQMLVEDEVAEDPKVQSFIEKSMRVKQRNAPPQTIFDITSSLVVGAGLSYEEISKMTVLQIYSTYYRIGAMKSYDTTTLFATVSGDVQIDQWNRNIDLFEKQTAGMKASEFNKNFGGLFK